jgi:hypothetical protein
MSRRAAARLNPIQAIWMDDLEGYKVIFLETEEFVRPVLFVRDFPGIVQKGYTLLGKFKTNKDCLIGPFNHSGHFTYLHKVAMNRVLLDSVLYERLPYEIKGTDIIFLKEIK